MSAPAPQQLEKIRQAIREYDYQRRFTANRIISTAFAGLLGVIITTLAILLLSGNIKSLQTEAAWLIEGTFCGCFFLYCVSFLMMRWRHLAVAVALTLLATDIAIVFGAMLWIFLLSPPDNRGNPVAFAQFTSLDITILLAAILGEWWLTLLTTFLMSVLVVLITHFAAFNDTTNVFLPLVLVQQWGIATIGAAFALLYGRNLADLGRAYIQTQELDTLKDQFITHVNHELRTPIMTMQGYIEFLRLSSPKMTPEGLTDILERASRTGYSLLALLNSILDIRRIDGGDQELVLQPILVHQIIARSLEMVNPREGLPEERHIQIEIPADIRLLGEPFRVQQIITNLVSNALKYSSPGTPIIIIGRQTLAAPPTERPQATRRPLRPRPMCEIMVRDYGLGIPPEQLSLLFNRFVRLPRDLASQVIGNGLGLYLCRVLATEMGGWIWAESSGVAGEGSTFHLMLPVPQHDDTVPRLRALSASAQ